MILDEIGAYLEAEGVGIIGQTLFLGSMPQDEPGTGSQDAVMALIEIPGRGALRAHDKARIDLPRLSIRTRGMPYGYPAARQKAQEAWNALEALTNQPLSGVLYLRSTPQGEVFWLRTDDYQRPYFLFDIECMRSS
jgi:hypothetical protein